MKSAAGVNDRDGIGGEDVRELGNGGADLLVAGRVLEVEIGVEDAHTGNVRRLGPLVRCAGLDRLGSDPCVFLIEEPHCIVGVEILDSHCGRSLDLIRCHCDKIAGLKPKQLRQWRVLATRCRGSVAH